MLTRVFKRVTLPGWTLATDSQFTLPYEKPAAFADDKDISDWAKDSVYFMAANGIINGVGNNKFAPKNVTTEEQEPIWCEIKPGHFVYGNNRELDGYRKQLGL